MYDKGCDLMYDDNHRLRFDKVPIAAYSASITPDSPQMEFACSDYVPVSQIHNHKDFEIILIKSGCAVFDIDSSEYFVEENDLIFINPYELHSIKAIASRLPFSHYCFTFDLSIFGAPPEHPASGLVSLLLSGGAMVEAVVHNDFGLINVFQKLENAFECKRKSREYHISACMYELFAEVYDRNLIHMCTTPSKDKLFVQKVQKYIDVNITQNITSSDAAAELGYDNSYFCRIFRRNFGQTFGEYLNFHRVNYARRMLDAGMSVTDAAMNSGYNNLSYFIKNFKKYIYIKPSEYISQSISNAQK